MFLPNFNAALTFGFPGLLKFSALVVRLWRLEILLNGPASIVVQWAIGMTLLFSSIAKWRDWDGFVSGVADYEILPERFSNLLAAIIVLIETWSTVAHLSGWLLKLALPATITMFTGFTLAVAINLMRGRRIPCHCFGNDHGQMISGRTLARLFLLLAGEGFLVSARGFQTGRYSLPWQVTGWTDINVAILWTALLLVGNMWLLRLTDLRAALRSTSTK